MSTLSSAVPAGAVPSASKNNNGDKRLLRQAFSRFCHDDALTGSAGACTSGPGHCQQGHCQRTGLLTGDGQNPPAAHLSQAGSNSKAENFALLYRARH